jgi:release factor glutamine methyltransferase
LETLRLGGEPLQYLEGTAPFGPFDLVVDERVLIPRPETEQLWELAQRVVDAAAPRVVVDLCTGSGALAIACKSTWPESRVFATDLSRDALEVARANIVNTGVDVAAVHGDLFGPLPDDLAGRVDVVVSNPPYVRDDEWELLPIDVRAEPRMALVSGPSGLEILERIAHESLPWLNPGSVVICEMGEEQGHAVQEIFATAFTDVEVRKDLAGRDRFVVAVGPRI